MARAHGEVGDSEVEELFSRARLVFGLEELSDAFEVLVDSGFEGAFEEVFDCEVGGEVGAGCFAFAGCVMEVDLSGGNNDVARVASRQIGILLDGEVLVRSGERGFEEPFVDGAELAD